MQLHKEGDLVLFVVDFVFAFFVREMSALL